MTGARLTERPGSTAARRRWPAIVALIAALALIVAGCGSKSSTTTNAGSGSGGGSSAQISHTKAKFVLHAGLAFGAFHRYIYKPARAGEFAHPFLHKLTIVKAALAGGFVYHEVKLAIVDARADKTLSKLVAPVSALGDKIRSVVASLKSGHPDTSSISQANGSIGSVGNLASSAGHPIKDIVPSGL